MTNEFKTKENKRKNIYNRKYKQSNPEKVKEFHKRANAAYKQWNREKVKESQKRLVCKTLAAEVINMQDWWQK